MQERSDSDPGLRGPDPPLAEKFRTGQMAQGLKSCRELSLQLWGAVKDLELG